MGLRDLYAKDGGFGCVGYTKVSKSQCEKQL